MAVVYNINVKSKFELFLNDDFGETEPDELVKKLSDDKKKKELAHKEAKKQKYNEVKKPAPKPAVESEPTKLDDKLVTERGQRLQKSDTKPKNSGQKTVMAPSKPELAGDGESADDRGHGSKEKRSSGNTPRRGRGREFDRHSGSDKTGVKSVERRDGSGSYNWGNVKDIVDLSLEPTMLESKDDGEKVIEVADENEKKEAEKPVMTISEWKALHSKDTIISSLSHVPTRPANNGENVFTGMNPYQKKNVQQSESDNEIVVPDDETDSKGRRQIRVNIEFSGRGRRGRAGFNNSRFKRDDNKGGAIATNKDGVVINLDEEEFPSLS